MTSFLCSPTVTSAPWGQCWTSFLTWTRKLESRSRNACLQWRCLFTSYVHALASFHRHNQETGLKMPERLEKGVISILQQAGGGSSFLHPVDCWSHPYSSINTQKYIPVFLPALHVLCSGHLDINHIQLWTDAQSAVEQVVLLPLV